MVGVPSVRGGLGQHGCYVAVEVDPEVVEHVQVDRHFVCIRHMLHLIVKRSVTIRVLALLEHVELSQVL